MRKSDLLPKREGRTTVKQLVKLRICETIGRGGGEKGIKLPRTGSMISSSIFLGEVSKRRRGLAAKLSQKKV